MRFSGITTADSLSQLYPIVTVPRLRSRRTASFLNSPVDFRRLTMVDLPGS